MSDIYSTLKADHDRHRELLETIENTEGASGERKAAWKEFYQDVKAHGAAEEDILFQIDLKNLGPGFRASLGA
ncbi:hemerythrin domain-containing protein [Marinovum sp. KMM 9879]